MEDNERLRYAYDAESSRRASGGRSSRYVYNTGPGEVEVKGPSPKLIIGIVIAAVLVIAAVVVAFVLWLNSKQPVSPERFTEVMEDHGRRAARTDLDSGTVRSALQTEDGEITYYLMRDSETARRLFHEMQDEAMRRLVWKGYTDINMIGHESCAITTAQEYIFMAYTDDTVVFARTEAGRRDELKAIIKELGY